MLRCYFAWRSPLRAAHAMKSVALSRLTNGPLLTVREMIEGRGGL